LKRFVPPSRYIRESKQLKAPDEHLTSGQIAQFADRDRFEITDELLAESWRRAGLHFLHCEVCQGLVESQKQIDRRLRSLKDLVVTTTQGKCPSRSEWIELAAGIAPPERITWLLDHAICCEDCSELLRCTTADFAHDVTADEETSLGELASNQLEWQKHLATRLSKHYSVLHGGDGRKKWPPSVFVWVGWAVACVAFAILTVTLLRGRDSVAKTNRLLARAYADSRPFDFRIVESEYGPVRLQRGNTREEAPPLLEARVALNRLRTSHEDDPEFLLAQGRAELLAMNLSSALSTLKRARELRPQSTAVLVDLASANAELADTGVTENYETALELLDEAMRQNPSDLIALFDRAIVYERLQSYPLAVQAWQAYLAKSPTGPWADEARKRESEDEEKLKKATEDQSPESLLRVLESTTDLSLVSAREEEFLDFAASSWIEDARTTTSRALNSLSHSNIEWNQDYWLRDLVARVPTPVFYIAAKHLAAAVQENEASDHDAALIDARQAKSEFATLQNQAGEIRAEFEETHALQRSGHAKECLAKATRLASDAKRERYSWIETDSVIEEANCTSWLGGFAAAQELLDIAGQLASQYRYPTLGLRVVGIRGSVDANMGAIRSAWSRNLAGLSEFWSGSFPPSRAYQFYSVMSTLAERAKDWCALSDFASEAASEAELTPYRYFQAISEFRFAEGAASCGEKQSASLHFEISARLFAELPATPATRLYLFDAKIRKASLDIDLGHAATALAGLRELKSQISPVDPNTLLLQYYNALGRLSRDAGDLTEASWAYSKAIETATNAAADLKTTTDRANWIEESSASYRGKVAVLLAEGNTETALDTWETYRGGRSANTSLLTPEASRVHSPVAVDVRANSSRLNGHIFISYMRSDDGLEIWAYDGTGIEHHHVAVAAAILNQTVSRFIELCSTPSSPEREILDLAHKLYGWYIAPVEERVSKSGMLTIEPDGPDWNLPFGALQDGNGQYLASKLGIAQVSSLSDWLQLREKPRISKDDSALFITNPSVSEQLAAEFPPLQGTDAETSAISEMFRRPQVLSGSNANLLSVRTSLPGTALLYFGGHADVSAQKVGLVLSGEDSSGTGPAMMSPGAFWPSLFGNLKIVVLASCSTGKKVDTNHAAESIAQSFESLGVPNVIAARWDVDSKTTSQFMQIFYKTLLSGNTVSASLQNARQSIRNQPATSHPYYWAAFAVFGRG
jgi:CHAT domain-containing protein